MKDLENIKILLRTNSGKEGLGHLNRMYSMYKAFEKESKVNCEFMVNSESKRSLISWRVPREKIHIADSYDKKNVDDICGLNYNLIILDSYKASDGYINMLKRQDKDIKVGIVYDYNIYKNIEVDFLINGNIYGESIEYTGISYEKSFLGAEYLILNPYYWEEQVKKSSKEKEMLITCGGSDEREIMIKIINKIKMDKKLKKNIVVGPFFKESYIKKIEDGIDESFEIIYRPDGLLEYMRKSDLILTAAGSTVYEALSLGVPIITYTIDDDQKLIEEELEKNGVMTLGDIDKIKLDFLEDFDIKIYSESLEKLYTKVDRRGAIRLAKEIIKTLELV